MKKYKENNAKDIGLRLRKLREDNGFRRDEIIKEFNISYNVLFNIETSKSEPNLDLVVKFANKYNSTLEFIITGVKPNNND